MNEHSTGTLISLPTRCSLVSRGVWTLWMRRRRRNNKKKKRKGRKYVKWRRELVLSIHMVIAVFLFILPTIACSVLLYPPTHLSSPCSLWWGASGCGWRVSCTLLGFVLGSGDRHPLWAQLLWVNLVMGCVGVAGMALHSCYVCRCEGASPGDAGLLFPGWIRNNFISVKL